MKRLVGVGTHLLENKFIFLMISVVDLLANNPFVDKPPTYIRAILYKYHFTEQG